MSDKLFALWRYNSGNGETLLGAPIEKIDDEGWVHPRKYLGYRFNPVKILPEKAGEKVFAEFKALDEARAKAFKTLEKEFDEKFKQLLKKHKISTP